MAVGIVLGVVVGQWLDKRFSWHWATVVGAIWASRQGSTC